MIKPRSSKDVETLTYKKLSNKNRQQRLRHGLIWMNSKGQAPWLQWMKWFRESRTRGVELRRRPQVYVWKGMATLTRLVTSQNDIDMKLAVNVNPIFLYNIELGIMVIFTLCTVVPLFCYVRQVRGPTGPIEVLWLVQVDCNFVSINEVEGIAACWPLLHKNSTA